MVTRSIKITDNTNAELKETAERLGISVNALICIRLAEQNKKGEK